MPITRIVNVDVLDAHGKRKNSDVAFVGSPGNILPSDADSDIVLNGRGCTLLPGLIDTKLDSGPSDNVLTLSAAYGTTTTIDASSSSMETKAIREAAARRTVSPSFLSSGSAIGPDNSDLVSMRNYSGVQTVRTPKEARRLVREKLFFDHADFIKVIVDQPGLRADVITAIVKEAHHFDKLAVAQSSQVEAYRMAVKSGFDVLSPVPVDGELDPELIQRIIGKNIGIIPTLCFLERALPLWRRTKPEYQFSYALNAVTALNSAGARICAGSSANNWSDFSLPFGKGLHNELQLLDKAGLSNEKLIKAVTSEPAALFRLHDRGVIEDGRVADLIMVEGDPLQDIQLLSKIRSVWLRGITSRT